MTITAVANAKAYDWSTWMLGIMRSFISGGSAAMVSGMAGMGIAPDKFNLNNGIGATFKLMGVMFLFQGLYRMFEFLQLHATPEQLQAQLDTAASAAKVAQSAAGQVVQAVDAAKAAVPEATKKSDE